jgi:nitroimidazol reductase NimA-like FMN-containing flavoprotein (pyridoxamine 5'-phosphate oxidase superfamily)
MNDQAIAILNQNRTMAISTLRPDGWPQTTIVGYANDGFVLYFLIFRASQKFANISGDDRVSLAIGQEPRDLRQAQAVYAAAFAAEVVNSHERERAWRLLVDRHPNLSGTAIPDSSQTALMRAECRHVSVLDYTKGLGHADALNLGVEDWAPAATKGER